MEPKNVDLMEPLREKPKSSSISSKWSSAAELDKRLAGLPDPFEPNEIYYGTLELEKLCNGMDEMGREAKALHDDATKWADEINRPNKSLEKGKEMLKSEATRSVDMTKSKNKNPKAKESDYYEDFIQAISQKVVINHEPPPPQDFSNYMSKQSKLSFSPLELSEDVSPLWESDVKRKIEVKIGQVENCEKIKEVVTRKNADDLKTLIEKRTKKAIKEKERKKVKEQVKAEESNFDGDNGDDGSNNGYKNDSKASNDNDKNYKSNLNTPSQSSFLQRIFNCSFPCFFTNEASEDAPLTELIMAHPSQRPRYY